MLNQILGVEGLTQKRVNALCSSEADNKLKNYIASVLSSKIGRKAVFDENTKELYSNLFTYFMGREGKLDLRKGIALVGSYGVGKSTAFNVFHHFLKTAFPFKGNNLYRIVSVEEIVNDYNAGNFIESVNIYNSKPNVHGNSSYNPVNVLVNEFGHEYKGKNYGTNYSEIFEMFMMKRYDIFQQNMKLTHITTNYFPSELEELFDTRLVDRFAEMFNFVEVGGKSFRE